MAHSPADESHPGKAFVEHNAAALRVLIDAIVPADDFPSASAAGGLDFLAGIFDERPDWIAAAQRVLAQAQTAATLHTGRSLADLGQAEVTALIDAMVGDDDYGWFARLVNGGYYADPGNGGNRDARSWQLVGWRPGPAGGWPDLPPVADRRRFVSPETALERYDAIVIGSGAGGGVAAGLLAESGRRVLVVEAGPWPDAATLATDHFHNPRSTWGVESLSGPPDHGHPRVLETGDGRFAMRPSDGRWGNNAFTAGGGTRVYGAQAWRFGPKDFAMASTYGVPDGSDLADWPFGYDELAPYYERAEWEVGVSGDPTFGAHVGPLGRGYPMPALPAGRSKEVLRRGAERLGFATQAVPLLVNSTAYLGRPACAQCAMCVGFACPIDAKNGSQNTLLDRAFATGRCDMLVKTTAERVVTDGSGRVIGVALVGERDGAIWRRTILAADVVLAAGATETARLLLNSASAREPFGLGNNHDQVGRRLQGHAYSGATAIFDETIEDLLGPGVCIGTTDFRHGNDGIIGGGILANEFVPTPTNAYRYMADSGLIPLHGAGAKRAMRDDMLRMTRIMGPIQEVTSSDSRVRVDPAVTDRFGIPVAVLSGRLHEEDIRARAFTTRKATEWLTAAGAKRVAPMRHPPSIGPSTGQHQAGTCRMGNDPSRSVTDPYGRVWGHDNLRVADGSLHVTNGGVNPVLTIFANAFRVIDLMTSGRT